MESFSSECPQNSFVALWGPMVGQRLKRGKKKDRGIEGKVKTSREGFAREIYFKICMWICIMFWVLYLIMDLFRDFFSISYIISDILFTIYIYIHSILKVILR